MAYTTFLYELKSGKVLRVEKCLYISKGKDKERYCPGYRHNEIGVLYTDGIEITNTEELIIKDPNEFGKRLLYLTSGTPITIERMIKKFRKICEEAESIKYECEGGLGDHLLEAAACLQFKETYPDKWIAMDVKKQYEDLLKKIEGIDLIGAFLNQKKLPKGTITVSGRTEYMTDPRGLGYGKQSLYGIVLGLEQIKKKAKIIPSPEDLIQGEKILTKHNWNREKTPIGIQFVSASGKAKSWPLKNLEAFIKLIYKETNYEAIILGKELQYPKNSKLGINLTNGLTWLETFQVLTNCKAVVCIDSGVLHLARAMEKPYIALWGGTTPEYIIGEKTGIFDIRINIECKDKLCIECPKGTNQCMKEIKPEMVLAKLKNLI